MMKIENINDKEDLPYEGDNESNREIVKFEKSFSEKKEEIKENSLDKATKRMIALRDRLKEGKKEELPNDENLISIKNSNFL